VKGPIDTSLEFSTRRVVVICPDTRIASLFHRLEGGRQIPGKWEGVGSLGVNNSREQFNKFAVQMQ
jgi:hypothetical protein